MLGIEEIRGLLPSVHIKSVILQDPKQIVATENVSGKLVRSPNNMNVRLKVSAITTIDNELTEIGSNGNDFLAVPDFNFNDHLRVAVIQSYDQGVTSVLQSMGSDITKYLGPLNDWKGNQKFDDILYSTVLSGRAKLKSDLPDFKKETLSVQTKGLFEQIKKPILEKIDKDGNEIRTMPIDFSFTVSQNNPLHLTYFTLCYLDFDSMTNSLKQTVSTDKDAEDLIDLNPSDFDKVGTFSTPLKNDVVFDDGRISSSTFFFKTLNGKIWTGPVHQTPSGEYITGNKPSSDSAPVQLIESQNVKIQDFRNRDGMMAVRIMDDFRNEERVVRDIISGFEPKDRALNPVKNSKHPYISDLFLSLGTKRASKFMFLINFDDLLTNNSIFGKTIKTNSTSLRKKIFDKSTIKSMKIYREKVKKVIGTNSIGSPADRFRELNEPPILVASTTQEKNKKIIVVDSKITEEVNMSFADANVRAFNVKDTNFTSTSRGQYRYRIELEVRDGTLEFLREKAINLRDFASTLENYVSDIMNSTIRDDDPMKSDDPHIQDTTTLYRTREVGGYDRLLDNLTQDYAVRMENKYGQDVRSGIEDFIEVLKIFSRDENFDPNKESKLNNFLNLISSSKTTSPESILVILELLYQSIAKLSSFIGENVEITNPEAKKSENVITRNSVFSEKGVIFIGKKFSNILDLTNFDVGGYDYLSKNTAESTRDSSSDVGLKTLSGKSYRERADRETLKFFRTTEPDITEGMTAQGIKFAGADSAIKSSLSYFSPAVVRVNPPIDVLNASRVDDNSLTKLIETKMAKSVTEIENSDQTPVPSPGFAAAARRTSRKAYDKTGVGSQTVAFPDQVDYFKRNFNLTTDMGKVFTLADRKNDNVQLPTEDEPAKAESESANKPTSTSSPMSFYTSIFQRDISKNKNDKESAFKRRGEEDASELFNLNNEKNYLMGSSQAAVTNLPNQIKALFISSTGATSQVKFNPASQRSKDIFKDPDQSSSAKMRYNLLVEVQYLSGFEIIRSEGKRTLLMSAPKFRKLTPTAFSSFVGSKLICRLRKYEIPQLGIIRPKRLDVPVYDEYFILEPDVPLTGVEPGEVAGEFLRDPSRGLARRPSFGDKEREFSDVSEFGLSRKPRQLMRLRSLRKRELLREIEKQKVNISSNLVSDAFRSNIKQSGRFVAEPQAGTLVSKRIEELRTRSRTSARDTGERVRYANPALTTKINPDVASVKTSTSSALARTKLPELKATLNKHKTELSLLEKKASGLRRKMFEEHDSVNELTGKTERVASGIEAEKNRNMKALEELEKRSELKDFAGFTAAEKALKERLGKKIEQANKSVAIINRNVGSTNKKIEKKEKQIKNISKEIAEEAKELQRKIIRERVETAKAGILAQAKKAKEDARAAQTKKTKTPHADTEGLQNIFSLDISKAKSESVSVRPSELKKFMDYKSYMSAADADKYDEILEELSSFVDGDDILSESEVVSSVISDIREEHFYEHLEAEEGINFDFVSVVEQFKRVRDKLDSAFSTSKKRRLVSEEIAKRVAKSGISEANRDVVVKTILDDVFEGGG